MEMLLRIEEVNEGQYVHVDRKTAAELAENGRRARCVITHVYKMHIAKDHRDWVLIAHSAHARIVAR